MAQVGSTHGGPRIAIIGGGIGGLTLALALRQRGLNATVFEQAAQLTEIGAAVALSANATRELRRLGVLDAIAACSTEPSALIYRDWHSGRTVASHAVHQDLHYQTQFGAPYFGVHRADLQRILGGAFGAENLRLDHRLTGLEDIGRHIRLTFANGHTEEADLVVGADGVRSKVREWVTGTRGVVYSGTSAFRGIVPVADLPSLPDPLAIQFWMGPDAHLLHYAIGGGGEHINFFAVTEGPSAWPSRDRWVIEAEPGEAAAAFAGWHPAVEEMVAAGWVTKRWGLFVVQQPPRWHRGRAVLLGDAAHAMLPHHGQGANTTIEDAITLAALIPGSALEDWEATMARYQSLRRVRTRTIQRSSWATNTMLHLSDGPAIASRNERVARFPDQFGWIHAFDALQSAVTTSPA